MLHDSSSCIPAVEVPNRLFCPVTAVFCSPPPNSPPVDEEEEAAVPVPNRVPVPVGLIPNRDPVAAPPVVEPNIVTLKRTSDNKKISHGDSRKTINSNNCYNNLSLLNSSLVSIFQPSHKKLKAAMLITARLTEWSSCKKRKRSPNIF